MNLNPEWTDCEFHLFKHELQRPRLKNEQGTTNIPGALLQNPLSMRALKESRQKLIRREGFDFKRTCKFPNCNQCITNPLRIERFYR
jgi:hypothetical protein